jgi:UDP-N-acetylglucosamine transferase subunit ALG13
MIFVTVGSVLPFDRLVRAADEWAGRAEVEIFFQIGAGAYLPKNGAWVRTMSSASYASTMKIARLLVAHAGMGSILQALDSGCPMLLLPRIREFGEVTTDHQIHTAARLSGIAGLNVAYDTASLGQELTKLVDSGLAPVPTTRKTPEVLISAVRRFAVGATGDGGAKTIGETL